jgi:hypothetical protein
MDMWFWKINFTGNEWAIPALHGTLVATNVFLFALSYLLAKRNFQPFLSGFAATGMTAVLVYWICCWLAPYQVLSIQRPLWNSVLTFYYIRAKSAFHLTGHSPNSVSVAQIHTFSGLPV